MHSNTGHPDAIPWLIKGYATYFLPTFDCTYGLYHQSALAYIRNIAAGRRAVRIFTDYRRFLNTSVIMHINVLIPIGWTEPRKKVAMKINILPLHGIKSLTDLFRIFLVQRFLMEINLAYVFENFFISVLIWKTYKY